MYNYIKRTMNQYNRLPFLPFSLCSCLFCKYNFCSTNCCLFITLISLICKEFCAYMCCAFTLVYIWPWSSSSCDVGFVAIIVTHAIDGKTIVIITYFVDFVWVDTYCSSWSIALQENTSFKRSKLIKISTLTKGDDHFY